MKRTVLIVLLFSLFSNVHAQQNGIRVLRIGDTIPDLVFTIHLGNSIRTMHLSEFGKPIIFDFWGQHCGTCIVETPHLSQLQQQFKDKIDIVRFTNDPGPAIDKLWADVKTWSFRADEIIHAKDNLYSITDDSVLLKMFPTHQYGLNFWIDKNRVIRVLTGSSIRAEDIETFLQGQTPNLPVHHLVENLDHNRPLTWFGGSTDFSNRTESYSIFLKYIELGSSGGFADLLGDSSTNKTIGMTCVNRSILELYTALFRNKLHVNRFDYNIVLEAKDTSRFERYYDDSDRWMEWIVANTYCYALKVPLAQSDDVFNIMKQDLDRYFGLSTSIDKRKIKCWVLKRSGSEDKLRSKGGKSIEGPTMTDSGKLEFIIQNSGFGRLNNEIINVLAAHHFIYSFTPFIDETNYKGKIDLDITWDKGGSSYGDTPISFLQQWLKNYGLELVEEYRERNVLVIKDAPKHG